MNITHQPYADTLVTAELILDFTLVNGGGTFNTSGQPLVIDHGFMVATKKAPTLIFEYDNPKGVVEIARFIERLPHVGNRGRGMVGVWMYGTEVYVDTVEIIESLVEAQAAAIIREEIAIWDNAKMKEIII